MVVQRELLHAVVNRTFHRLLLEQQRCLYHLGFPGFSAEVINMLEDCINNALSNAAITNPYIQTPKLLDMIARQSVLVCACLSLRLHSRAFGGWNNENISDNAFHQSIDTNGVMGTYNVTTLRRMSSLENDRSGDWTTTSGGKRKRRRRVKSNDALTDGNYSSQSDFLQYSNSVYPNSNNLKRPRPGAAPSQMQVAYDNAFHPSQTSTGFPTITVPDLSTIAQLASMPTSDAPSLLIPSYQAMPNVRLL